MNQLMFSESMKPERVMSRFELCSTKDLNVAREWGEKIFCENKLRSRDASDKVDTRIYYRNLGNVGLGRMTYGGDVTIESELGSFILVQMPIYGNETVIAGNNTVHSNPMMGSILNYNAPFCIHHFRHTEKLIIRIDRSTLELHCQQHLGRMLRKNIEFKAGMELNAPDGQRWIRMISYLYDQLSIEGKVSPLLVAQFESTLVNMLLICQRHNYSDELHTDNHARLAPSFIKRVEGFIEEHAAEPITITDMAKHAGVSTRSLYAGFRRYRNTSPMQYLKDVRLACVREDLAKALGGAATVTEVAYRWGFNHLGHFATDYKKRFGETPSKTLIR